MIRNELINRNTKSHNKTRKNSKEIVVKIVLYANIGFQYEG